MEILPGKEMPLAGSTATSREGAPFLRVSPTSSSKPDGHPSQAGSTDTGQSTAAPMGYASRVRGAFP